MDDVDANMDENMDIAVWIHRYVDCGWIKLMQMSLSDSARRASLVAALLKCQLRTPMDSHGHPERIAVNSQQRQCVSLS